MGSDVVTRHPERTLAMLRTLEAGQPLRKLTHISSSYMASVAKPLLAAGIILPRGHSYQLCAERAAPLMASLDALSTLHADLAQQLKPV